MTKSKFRWASSLVLAALAVLSFSPISRAETASPAMTQADVNAMTDSTAKAAAQWGVDQGKKWPTQSDNIERLTDKDANGKERLFFTPQKLTTADCLPGRHWELIQPGGIAGCVCDGDTTHKQVSNDQPAACVPPKPVDPPPFIPDPPSGGGGNLEGFSFGGLGSPKGFATPVSDAITGNWHMTANYGPSLDITYSGNIGSQVGIFSGVCNFSVTDIGSGTFALNGPCGGGYAYGYGGVYVNINHPSYTGTLNGTWGEWGANGALNATLRSGIKMFTLSQSGSTIGFIMMDGSGNFNGYNMGNAISGYLHGSRGAITLGGGVYLAALRGDGEFGTLYISGSRYAIGGQYVNFFAVDSGGSIFATGAIQSVMQNEPTWHRYFTQNNIDIPNGSFNAILSSGGSLIPGSQSGNGYNFGYITVTAP